MSFSVQFSLAHPLLEHTQPVAAHDAGNLGFVVFPVDEFLTLSYPQGLTQIRELPNLTQTLFDRRYDEAEIAGIMGGNWLRVFKQWVG